MAGGHRELAGQPSIDSLMHPRQHSRQHSPPPLSIAFDDTSIKTQSPDLEWNHNIQRHDFEKPFHPAPTAQNSLDPIFVRESNSPDPTLVDWDGDRDPENPLYWPLRRKLWMSAIASFMTFGVSVASSIFSSDVEVTAYQFGVGEEVMILGVSLYVLGFACGPLVFGPISELYGRAAPLMIGFFCFAIFQIPLALATNLETIFVCRFLAAAFGAAPVAIAPGILVDLWEPYARGIASLLWALTVFAGPTVGPIVGAFTVMNPHLGWRWTAWLVLIIAMVMWLISVPTISETFGPILLQRKAARLRYQTRNWALHSKRDEKPIRYAYLARKYGLKPLQMLIQEPILASMTAFMALVYAIIYLMFVAYPYSFQVVRGWPITTASLTFAGLFVGYLLACIICMLESTIRFQRLLRKNNGKVVPEERLPSMILGSFVIIAGLFWFAWTSSPHITWIPQVIASVSIGCGVFLIFVPGQVYLMDVYTVHAASALAGNAFIRAALACAFPLVATPMYEKLGVAWGMSLLGFLCVALTPFPILFYLFGSRIRGWSKYVPERKDPG